MVRSESADEDQIFVDDQYDMMDDNDMMDSTRSLAGWPAQQQTTTFSTLAAAAGHAPLLTNRSNSQQSSLSPTSGSAGADPDRRLRRQIANCNERRRMQSINAGFMTLRSLLPRKEGEKLSKAAILQQTADLIHRLLEERCESVGGGAKKAKMDFGAESDGITDARATISRLQSALEREKTIRAHLEQQLSRLQQEQHEKTKAEVTDPVTPSSSPREDEMQPAAAALCSLSMIALNNTSPLQQLTAGTPFETSVIRPTPLAPISVDVSSPSLSTPPTPIGLHQQQQGSITIPTSLVLPTPTSTNQLLFPMISSTQPSTPTYHPIQTSLSSAFSSTAGVAGAHASLQTILDAIKHLESNANLALQPPPPTSQAPLVR